MHLLGEALDRSTQSGARILSWHGAPDATGDAVGLRLAGALHALVRRGDLPDLVPLYMDHTRFSDDAMIELILAAISAKDETINRWLDFAPQTNEVRRAAIIYAGILEFIQQSEMHLQSVPSIALYELGASGGLNLSLADFEYHFRGTTFGKQGSSVQLSPEWRGPLPGGLPFKAVSRKGCDLNPLYVENQEDSARLLAYLWPDQPERIARTEAANKLAMENPPILYKMPADDWVEAMLNEEDDKGAARIFFNTIAWQYFPEETKSRIKAAFQSYGSNATKAAPLAWLSFEMADNNAPELILQVWPSGEKRRLALANAHVEQIEWVSN